MISLIVTADNEGMRLDRLVRRSLPLRPLGDIYRLIRVGLVTVNDKKTTPELRVHAGDVLRIDADISELPTKRPGEKAAVRDLARTDFYKRNLSVVYEDEDLLACNKPPNLVVHPGTGHSGRDSLIDLVACYLASGRRGGPVAEPVLVHRIDRDTSGIILIAKNKRILRGIHERFRDRAVEKRYFAVCHGRPPHARGVIEANLVKTVEPNSGTKVCVYETGQFSSSQYSVVRSTGARTLMEVAINTGRTHQIRVHLAHIGCPIIGDVRYGDSVRDQKFFSNKKISRRLYLHAAQIGFFHPAKKMRITLNAPLPDSFLKIMDV